MKKVVGYMTPPKQVVDLKSVELPEEANDAKRLALSYANRMKEAHESLLLY
jgi:hypothetical protein